MASNSARVADASAVVPPSGPVSHIRARRGAVAGPASDGAAPAGPGLPRPAAMMSPVSGLVSRVLPVRDRAAWVAQAVASVFDQTYRPLELIAVDDGSTDDTRHALVRFGSRLTLVSQGPAGAYAARNAGLRRAGGELGAFIDSDDPWLPDRLARQGPLMARPEVGLVFGDAVHVAYDAAGRRGGVGPTCFQVTPPRRRRAAAHFALGNFVPTSTVLVRRRCLDEAGEFTGWTRPGSVRGAPGTTAAGGWATGGAPPRPAPPRRRRGRARPDRPGAGAVVAGSGGRGRRPRARGTSCCA